MTPLSHEQFLLLRDKAELLEADHYGEKVLRLVNGNFLKLFRRKRLLSSAALYPYAQRFADNATALQQRGIPCPQVLDVYRISAIQRDAVHYLPLPGQTLRQITDTHAKEQLRQQLGKFIAQLHASGIYFRSLHLGNIVLTPEGELGLIDIADLQAQRSALGKTKRLRNFRHILRDPRDQDWLLENKNSRFFESYLRHASLNWNISELTRQLI
ncbi:lipopolysaccharide kinase InaA family protein [Pseudomonas sp. UBA2684]|uniref:lipopolysaccharide kinase InaA family protein n=1 Tax=Pseudomonas sp. UBA2684 TaxID=1947311 RepID=UPI000E88D242|nr:lipopolysaccharide kinase InaA family protein [Pseudomonas sp. UBA2684]HBX57091.1 toluene tolerance protein [Pseudomonas sp.]|tara:strand:- start:13627 stop:14265 length:639 start_codon:yes stop_codon:yes gene_type:complete